MSDTHKLQVGIVGAGIAGLSAAIALRKAGHDVEIFEKSKFSNEVGAAITIAPNGTRVLDRWDFDYEGVGAMENEQIRMPKGDTLEIAYQESFRDVEEKFGHKWLFFHRQDLHRGLRQMAESPETVPCTSCKINLGSAVVELDCEAGTLRTANGMEVKKDLLLVANGSHCQFVELINGSPNPIKHTGRSAYRCMVPFDKIKSDPLTWPLFENQPPGLFGPNLISKGIIIGNYPCRRGEVLSCAMLHSTKKKEEDAQDWDSPASLEDVMACMEGFHPSLQALYQKTEDIKVYNLMYRDPMQNFTRGKAVLIGDAAHPMLTNQAQGATISIESTGALEILFSHCPPSPPEVQRRLALFNKLRHARCVATQVMSNAPPGPPGYKMLVDGVRKHAGYQGWLPSVQAKPFSQEFREFFFGYDVFRESERAMKGEDFVEVYEER